MRKIILTFVLLLFAIPMIAQTQTDVTTTPITIIPPALKITTGAGANKVLTSDADGNATWQAAAGGDSSWVSASGDTFTVNDSLNVDGTGLVYSPTTNGVGIGTTTPGVLLELQQADDANGIALYGFDDKSGNYVTMDIDASGGTKLYAQGSGNVLSLKGSEYIKFQTSLPAAIFEFGSLNISNGMRFILDENKDETKITLNDNFGNHLILTNYANRDIDHDHSVQTHPTFYIHSDTNPNTNNTEWGSLAFIGTGSGGGYFNIANGVGDIVMQPTGNVGIGTTSPQTTLEVDGNIGIDLTNVPLYDLQVGDISGTYSGMDAGDANFTTSSDSAMKENFTLVSDLINPLQVANKMLDVPVYRFNWKKESLGWTDISAWADSVWSDSIGVDSLDNVLSGNVVNQEKIKQNKVNINATRISSKNQFGMIAQNFNDVFFNKPEQTDIDWQKVSMIQWYMIQELIKTVNDHEKRIKVLEK